MDIPTDSQARINGSYYKIGRHGLPYIWLDGDWLVSTMPISRLVDAIKNKARCKNDSVIKKSSKAPPDKSLEGGAKDCNGNVVTKAKMLVACIKLGLTLKAMRARIYKGWPIEDALSRPKSVAGNIRSDKA